MLATDHSPIVTAMLNPATYTHPVDRVEMLQTHISYVFLAGEYVYKIKKSVNFGFLNYSSLARRRYYCGREVTLNRRLCSDVYLGVVPIRDDGGTIHANGRRGKIIEYAVWMKRLPEERMMHNLLERGQVTVEMVAAVAEKLVPFHKSAQTSPRIARYGDWAIRYNCAENVRQWQPFIGRTITKDQDAILRAYLQAFYARKADVMKRRVDELRIRECHSDLRSDAVCFTCDEDTTDCICILDCVEFNRRIMMVDGARDVSFLAMDLEYRGHKGLAEAFVSRYKALADDQDLGDVLPYYAAYNACVRGKVESFLLDLPEVPEKEKREAAKRARRYFDLAVEYAKSLPPAYLVIACGLSGSGKSTVAAKLSQKLGAEVVSSDVIRKRLLGMNPDAPATEEYRAGIYSAEMTERTYRAMFDQARESLKHGRSVILDATFLRRSDRRAAARLAKETGAQFACVAISAAERETKQRMEGR
ncbi:MAG: AAA family ATPase, partial [Dehalococcoidia bacterium]